MDQLVDTLEETPPLIKSHMMDINGQLILRIHMPMLESAKFAKLLQEDKENQPYLYNKSTLNNPLNNGDWI